MIIQMKNFGVARRERFCLLASFGLVLNPFTPDTALSHGDANKKGCVSAAFFYCCIPNGIRTRVAGVKGRCPRPLDDGDKWQFPDYLSAEGFEPSTHGLKGRCSTN